jgi:hypothetical protein
VTNIPDSLFLYEHACDAQVIDIAGLRVHGTTKQQIDVSSDEHMGKNLRGHVIS